MTVPPRIRGGVCSAMYSGATNDAVPTERPSTNRAAMSQVTSWAKAAASAPTTYTHPERHFVHLRLSFSER
ncbi:MAG TPA: hypothetical protein VFX52_05590 [Nocardioidaceae bacterium]|nr:hypothetical protein [Nocardioidaceae bacterium]